MSSLVPAQYCSDQERNRGNKPASARKPDYVDGSRIRFRPGFGVYRKPPRACRAKNLGFIVKPFKLQYLLYLPAHKRDQKILKSVTMISDSPAALKPPQRYQVTSKCKNTLIQGLYPRSQRKEGNVNSDNLAKEGVLWPLYGPEPACRFARQQSQRQLGVEQGQNTSNLANLSFQLNPVELELNHTFPTKGKKLAVQLCFELDTYNQEKTFGRLGFSLKMVRGGVKEGQAVTC